MPNKLVLINPLSPLHSYMSDFNAFRCPPLSLAIVAALTPPEWCVEIHDETAGPISYVDADLVGITSFTPTSPRCYEIAAEYRAKGIPVVMGGVHASMCPDEAAQFVDVVVVGNAQDCWPRVLTDFGRGILQPRYASEPSAAPRWYPRPRYDLLSEKYGLMTVQTSVGCPMGCGFCIVPALYGKEYRRRPVEDVLEDVAQIKQKSVFFVDDNILGYTAEHRATAVEICKRLCDLKLNKTWTCQAPVTVADDTEFLRWAKRAGCVSILIGFEALDEKTLEGIGKWANRSRVRESYADTVEKIHRHGIAVLGMFMVGFEGDTPPDVTERARAIRVSSIDCYQFSIATPFPGTEFYRSIQERKRLLFSNFPHDWVYFDAMHATFATPEMSANALAEAVIRAHKQLYSFTTILRKLCTSLRLTRSVRAMMDALLLNIGYRIITTRLHPSIRQAVVKAMAGNGSSPQ